MKIPTDAIIPEEKLTRYLLVWRPRKDKSKFLAQAGFTLANPQDLEDAIRGLIAENEAVYDRTDQYGDFYRVEGDLVGTNGRILEVITIWLLRSVAGNRFHFITLKPGRKKR